ncbi:AMP-binding protein [Shimia aestuarii]|uniref:AMP-binding protein n=1 Tax=Shimia aestuarii TaxID=254406 RepID=UPI001FB4E597|nr:AMP-binding protein [Shimia aestuarii]
MASKLRDELSDPISRTSLIDLASRILQTPVDAERSLVSQGLDSLGAAELLEELQLLGYDVAYEFLLSETSIDLLFEALGEKTAARPAPSDLRDPSAPIALAGPQVLWAQLEQESWGPWANISLCLSMPASLIRAPFLPAIAQSLCDANEAMRMVLVQSGDTVQQQALPGLQLPVEVKDAPASDQEAMRLIEAFEGKPCSPFKPSTRALILSDPNSEGRHWMCITMHHVFSDRISMHRLARQLREMIASNRLQNAEAKGFDFSDVAIWKAQRANGPDGAQHATTLDACLARADITTTRPLPRVAKTTWDIFASLDAKAELRLSETDALERCAARLGTTLPLLLHTLASALIARLTGEDKALSGRQDTLLCHVVSNRERDPVLKDTVGCLDTSVPVAVRLEKDETLASLCHKTHEAFSSAHLCVSDLPRGGWIRSDDPSETEGQRAAALIERFPHINIVRTPTPASGAASEIIEHSVQRPQQPRWGLLLRATLPAKAGSESHDPVGAIFRAFSEDRVLAGLVPYCLVEILRDLLAASEDRLAGLQIHEIIARVVDRADFAATHVRDTSALVDKAAQSGAFIYEKLVARQQRWYQHDAQFRLRRDTENRFIGTPSNPFPFTQLDKLKERRFLESHDVPLPVLLHIVPKDRIAEALTELAPDLPKSFVIKPVGAGHSFGVTLVRNGIDLSRGGVPFDPATVGQELAKMAERGFCRHEGKVFPFNFSSFLIEAFVLDERGFPAPTDYKVFMIGERFLWLQLHFRMDGFNWVAFLDEEFRLLPQPAWDPATCWRTHRTLVCTDQAMVDARNPTCLSDMLANSKRLAREMGIFVRLDWYADRVRGPLMGEITTFPHMLQPRGFYTDWANTLVKSAWLEPDGAAQPLPSGEDTPDTNPIQTALDLLDQNAPDTLGIEAFLPPAPHALWSVAAGVNYGELRRYIAGFDLSPWDVTPGARVGILVENGVQLAAALLATMNRYVAVPIDAALPAAQIASEIEQGGLDALLTVAGSDAADRAKSLPKRPGLPIIALTSINRLALAELPQARTKTVPTQETPRNGLHDEVLRLRTSGTTGEPKSVGFTLSRLMRSGAGIGASLTLSPADIGVSMLPLHHVGGIACNLIAPLLAAAGMTHRPAFDPKTFFDALAGPQGATWCYLVPAMWGMVLDYARTHPELRDTRPWPRLRAIRSASADLPNAMARDLADLFGDAVAVLPTYGMTEAMPIAAPPLTYRLEKPRSVGRVLPSVSVEIVDNDDPSLPPVAPGQVGEITVKGPCVFDGYIETGGRNTDSFTPRGYFRTGDLGCLAADGSGWLRIEGRIKDTINTGGETIPPAHVEGVLAPYPAWTVDGVRVELMAFARKHNDLGEEVALAVVGAPDEMALSDLYSWAVAHLPPPQRPTTLVHLTSLPRSPNGKLQRAQFAERFNAKVPPGQTGLLETYIWSDDEAAPRLRDSTRTATVQSAHPATASEVSLAAVLEVIQQHVGAGTTLGPDTSLTDAGVNSLAAVELSLLLGDRFQLELPTWILSDHPTPRGLVAAIADLKTPGSGAPAPQERTDPPPSATPRSSALRVLFLHGEGADADLMEKSLRATHWTGRLSGKVEFVFLDAPHLCAPMPEFHAIAVEAGLYKKPAYRSWAVTEPDTLQQSLSAVRQSLQDLGPIDAIGGICDGALVAALIAMEHPELEFFLSMSPSPASSLDASWNGPTTPIPCRSLHLVSGSDEQHTLAQQLEITQWCEAASIRQHEHGHAVPRFSAALEKEVLQILGETPTLGSTANAPTQEAPRAPAPTLHLVTESARYEPVVAKYTAQILRRPHIGKTEDFFDAGGDSLKAMVLAMKLEQKLGMDLPFELLFAEGATVESMARAIAFCRDTNVTGVISPIGHSTASHEIYALPPLNGYHSAYLALSRALADTARLVGVKPPMLGKGGWNPSDRLQNIAEEAATAIAQSTDRKTIDLIGCSAGGVLAFETARVLVGWGYEIGCLAIVDTDFTSVKNRWPVPVKYIAEWQKHLSRRARGKTNLRRGYRHLHFRALLAGWSPEPVRIRAPIFFRAEAGSIDAEQIRLWREVIDGDLAVVDFPGPHEGFVLPEGAERIAHGIRTRGLAEMSAA